MITRTIRSFLPVAALACATLAFAQATPAAKPAPAPATTTAKPAVAAPAKDAGDTAAPAVAVPGPAKAEPLTAPKFKEVKFEGTKPTAKEILEKHIAATGGTKAWEAKKSMTSSLKKLSKLKKPQSRSAARDEVLDDASTSAFKTETRVSSGDAASSASHSATDGGDVADLI